MTETPAEPTTYAVAADVRTVLGKLGDRPGLPDLDAHVSMAHAEVLDRLVDVYGPELPEWRPDAAQAVRWAEAKLAAASVLDILRAARDDSSEVADRLRASAYATIVGGLPGQRPGDSSSPTTPPDRPVPVIPIINRDARYVGGLSNFADPYDPLGYPPIGEWLR